MKKTGILNGLIAIVSVLLVVSLVATLMAWLSPDADPDDPNGNNDPTDTTTIAVSNYSLYESEDLAFRFIIADVTFTSTKEQQVSIDKFVTSQQINLSEMDVYLEDLLLLDIDLADERHNIDLDFSTTTDEIELRLFIPLRINDSETLTLFYQGEEEVSLLFDLTKDKETLETLIDEEDPIDDQYIEEFIEEDLYSIKVVTISEIAYSMITETLADGTEQEMVLPSTARVIGVLVEIKALGQEAVIVQGARFNIPDDNQTSDAFDENVDIDSFENLFKVPVITEASGFIFFDVYTSTQDIISGVTEFEFKLNVVDHWIKVQVDGE